MTFSIFSERVPKTFYYNSHIVEFYTVKKTIYYKISRWDELGTNLALLKADKYNGEDPKSLITSEIKSCDK
jgi:hypothetical protein